MKALPIADCRLPICGSPTLELHSKWLVNQTPIGSRQLAIGNEGE